MAVQSVEALVEGGKATAAPPLGPALGPLGVNIGKVIVEINKKTESFKGMQVPVKISVDSETKDFTISIGTPPASALIKKEAGIDKASGKPKTEFVADLRIEQIIKIAKMKEDDLLGKSVKQKVKEIVGTCVSMGVMVEGMNPRQVFERIEAGEFDQKIKSGKTELTKEELHELEEERKKLQQELATKRAEFEARAKDIVTSMEGKEPRLIRAKMKEANLPDEIIRQFAPAEAKEKPAKK
jgi:large subunit ribosomal protein L11